MPNQTVTLTDIEWSQLMAVMANATGPGINWAAVNPLLMKVGDQLRAQQAGGQMSRAPNGLDPEPELPTHVRRRQAQPS